MKLRLTEIRLPVEHSEAALEAAIIDRLAIPADALLAYSIFRRSHDARNRTRIHFIYTLDVSIDVRFSQEIIQKKIQHVRLTPEMHYRFVASAPPAPGSKRPVIVGCGPCGLFAALILAQSGFRPIILERGKPVRERTKDTFGFWRQRKLDPESNVQFGEGGAGTFSDGKLHTQIRDPHFYGRKVLRELVEAGAPPEILYSAKPHIGTFRLVKVIENMRRTIESLGGEYRFNARVDDIVINNSRVAAVILSDGATIECDQLILAIGHSARDTFEMLYERGVSMTAKPFSIGVRIEHPQSLIDQCLLGPHAGNALIGAADYKVVHHCSNNRTVYSFCMCPGGTVVAAASEAGRVVTNGMSQYSRNERNANAALVVGVTPEDFPAHPLGGITFQRQLETLAYQLGGSNYDAPCQLVGDFMASTASTRLGTVIPSYKPGVRPTSLDELLPNYVTSALREALPAFNRKIAGFLMEDAVLTAIETRTSSPVRIERHPETLQSLNIEGLYPAGEGAGYAGGILSSAVDGIEVAQAVALAITAKS